MVFWSGPENETGNSHLAPEFDFGQERGMAPAHLSDDRHLRTLWRRIHASRIQMVLINNNTYLGLVPGRQTTSLLKIGEVLFIFAPANNPIISVTEFLSQVLRNVPDQSLGVLHNLTEKQLKEALGGAAPTAIVPDASVIGE
ncbi:MAG: hypothetical protein SFU56_17975 [Capsulimonadales bacterium]|nr:hypothetical protein [Capsulimonadales bacterium]